MKLNMRVIAAFFFIFVFYPASSYSEEKQTEDFDSWAQEFRQSLSEEERSKAQVNPAAADAAREPEIPKATPASELVDLNMGKSAGTEVVGLDTSNTIALERRVARLERDLRFMEDRLRTLDRTVDDLRRRR